MAKPQTKASNKYNAKAYDRIALQVKKGERDKLREHAEQRGESLNGFINRAITETVERDNSGNDAGNGTDKSESTRNGQQ